MRHTYRLHDAVSQQGAQVFLRSVTEGRSYRVAQHGDARIAVLESGSRLKEHRRSVPRYGERIVGHIQPLPKIPLPARQYSMRKIICFGILNARRVRAEVAHSDPGLRRVILPLGNILGSFIVQLDASVADRNRQRQSTHQCFGHRGRVVPLVCPVSLLIPFVNDPVVAND